MDYSSLAAILGHGVDFLHCSATVIDVMAKDYCTKDKTKNSSFLRNKKKDT